MWHVKTSNHENFFQHLVIGICACHCMLVRVSRKNMRPDDSKTHEPGIFTSSGSSGRTKSDRHQQDIVDGASEHKML